MKVPGSEEALERCLHSLKGQYDELILVINDGIGFGAAVNRGLKWASGDFLLIVNNDTVLRKGKLKDLFLNDRVTVPLIQGQPDWKPRCFYCMPRSVYEKVGGYDERFEIGYFEDDDLIKRWELAKISIEQVKAIEVIHQDGGGLTIKQLGEEENFNRNKTRFQEKWG